MVYEDLATKVNAKIRALNSLMTEDVAQFNKTVREANIPIVTVPK